MLLDISNLNCLRADKLILSDISLSLVAGDCVILRGPNGAGKTTFLRYLAGLAGNLTPQNIAFSGHLDGIKATLTVRENLSFWAGIYGFENIDPILEQLSLTHITITRGWRFIRGSKTPPRLGTYVADKC